MSLFWSVVKYPNSMFFRFATRSISEIKFCDFTLIISCLLKINKRVKRKSKIEIIINKKDYSATNLKTSYYCGAISLLLLSVQYFRELLNSNLIIHNYRILYFWITLGLVIIWIVYIPIMVVINHQVVKDSYIFLQLYIQKLQDHNPVVNTSPYPHMTWLKSILILAAILSERRNENLKMISLSVKP